MEEQDKKIEEIIKLLKAKADFDLSTLPHPEMLEEAKLIYSLYHLPKKEAPLPTMQRRYLHMAEKAVKFSWFHLPRIAIAGSLSVIVITATVGTGFAASSSVPGDTLFAVKRSAEQIRIKLTPSPEAKADLQVQLSKKRFSEAQKVFSNPKVEPEQTQAALTELVGQTKETLAAVETAVKENPESEKAASVLYSLETLTAKQQELLSEMKPVEGSEAVKQTEVALSESSAKLTEIRKIAGIAEKENVSDGTASTTPLVTGSEPSTNTNTPTTTLETVKGTSTPTQAGSATSSNLSSSSTSGSLPPLELDESVLNEFKKPEVTGSFIIEDPSPQYVP